MVYFQDVKWVVLKSFAVMIGQVPDFQAVVRDRAMNRTFSVVARHFEDFEEADWIVWFHGILVPLLPSFTPMMLTKAIAKINCTNYHIV